MRSEKLTPNPVRAELERRQRENGVDLTPGAKCVVRIGYEDHDAVVLGVHEHPIYGTLVDVRPRSIRVTADCVSKPGRPKQSYLDALRSKTRTWAQPSQAKLRTPGDVPQRPPA